MTKVLKLKYLLITWKQN